MKFLLYALLMVLILPFALSANQGDNGYYCVSRQLEFGAGSAIDSITGISMDETQTTDVFLLNSENNSIMIDGAFDYDTETRFSFSRNLSLVQLCTAAEGIVFNHSFTELKGAGGQYEGWILCGTTSPNLNSLMKINASISATVADAVSVDNITLSENGWVGLASNDTGRGGKFQTFFAITQDET